MYLLYLSRSLKMKSSELTDIQTGLFILLAVLSGSVIILTSALYCAYYFYKLRGRNFLGDLAIVNFFFSLILLFVFHIIGTLYENPEGNIYWLFMRKTITR